MRVTLQSPESDILRTLTCLWLNGLMPLRPTDIVDGRENKIWRMPPSDDRGKLRSLTYPGIAHAMADQWGGYAQAA